MACEEELNALRQAQAELARYRHQHARVGPGPVPAPTPPPTAPDVPNAGGVPEVPGAPDVPVVPGDAGPAPSETEVLQRLAELAAVVRHKQTAYDLCRGRTGQGSSVEALMRDATGRPLGGDAGPPM